MSPFDYSSAPPPQAGGNYVMISHIRDNSLPSLSTFYRSRHPSPNEKTVTVRRQRSRPVLYKAQGWHPESGALPEFRKFRSQNTPQILAIGRQNEYFWLLDMNEGQNLHVARYLSRVMFAATPLLRQGITVNHLSL
jgi:hypothetical protein